MQGGFSLLSMGKIQVRVYNMHWLLLKPFQWRANSLHRFNEHTPPVIPVSVSFAWVVSDKLVTQASVSILRNVLLVAVGGQGRRANKSCGGTSLLPFPSRPLPLPPPLSSVPHAPTLPSPSPTFPSPSPYLPLPCPALPSPPLPFPALPFPAPRPFPSPPLRSRPP